MAVFKTNKDKIVDNTETINPSTERCCIVTLVIAILCEYSSIYFNNAYMHIIAQLIVITSIVLFLYSINIMIKNISRGVLSSECDATLTITESGLCYIEVQGNTSEVWLIKKEDIVDI